jgi:kynurenine 3-monooxygenase
LTQQELYELFEHKIWDVSLDTATLHIGETERGAWKIKV